MTPGLIPAPKRAPFGSGKFHYGWVVVGVTLVVLMFNAGVRSAPGILIVPIEREFGWSRDGISMAVSIGLLLYGFSGPFAGQLMDRFGSRRIMLVGLLLATLSTAATALTSSLLELNFYWGVLSGIGTGATSAVLGVAVANRWFFRRRGMVTGLFSAGFSAGQLVFVPLLMSLVVSSGWRTAVVVFSSVGLVVLVPMLLLMRDDPSDVGLLPYGAVAPAAGDGSRSDRASSLSQVTLLAVRTPAFWVLGATFFVCGSTANGLIGTHLVPHSIEMGVSESTAAGAIALLGVMNFVGSLASGWLTDRVDPRKLLAAYYCLRAVSLFWLTSVTDFPGLAIFAIFYGLDYAATMAPTAALAGEIFGSRNAGTVYGWLSFGHQIGAALAAYLAGVARTALGDYQLSFFSAGLFALLGGMLILFVDRSERRLPIALELPRQK